MASTTEEIGSHNTINFDPHAVRRGVLQVRRDERRQLGWTERRARLGIPIRRAIYVTPVVMEGGKLYQAKPGRSCIVAYTTEVAPAGIGFTHDEPLPTLHAVVTFDREDEEPVSLLIGMEWSHCREDRRYRSGAKFLAVTDTPDFLCCPREAEPHGSIEPRRLILHGIRRQEVSAELRNCGEDSIGLVRSG
jgi:hypothetical protein